MKYHTQYTKQLADLLFEKYEENDITREQLHDALYNLEEVDYYFDEYARENVRKKIEEKE